MYLIKSNIDRFHNEQMMNMVIDCHFAGHFRPFWKVNKTKDKFLFRPGTFIRNPLDNQMFAL